MTIYSMIPAMMPKFRYNPLCHMQGMHSFTNMSLFSVPRLPIVLPPLNFPQFNFSFRNIVPAIKNTARKVVNTVTTGVKGLIDRAKRYIGYNEKDGSYLKFTNGRREAWCADFVSHIAKENGSSLRASSVEGIRQWGIKNGRYHSGAKVGDAIILKNGASHTGIVEKIENGKITVIEGNSSNRVKRVTYSINDRRISGFVTIA